MSFVDLMGNDVWSPSDIDARVALQIRSRFSADDELKAARLARKAEQEPEDSAFIADVDAWIAVCVEEGRQARADMALLSEVFVMEAAQRRLDLPALVATEAVDGDKTPSSPSAEEIERDAAERAEAQAIIDAASPEARALFDLRNPPRPSAEETEIIAGEQA